MGYCMAEFLINKRMKAKRDDGQADLLPSQERDDQVVVIRINLRRSKKRKRPYTRSGA